MADQSKIEWTDATWQIVTGCDVVSPGCTNCYAMRLAGTRLRNHPSRAGLTRDTKAGPVWNGEVRFNEQWLLQPLQWNRPRKIFVAAHGDLFHKRVTDEQLDRIFAVMALAHWHIFQIVTKRPERMREYFSGISDCPNEPAARDALIEGAAQSIYAKQHPGEDPSEWLSVHMPLPNVWLGVTAEDQQRADERREDFEATPAAVKFVSYEPALGPIDWRGWEFVDQIIFGGESGNGARPAPMDWARITRDFCAANKIAYFHKQNGEFVHSNDERYARIAVSIHDGGWFPIARGVRPRQMDLLDRSIMRRVGKARAGRLLDGREHNEFPGGA